MKSFTKAAAVGALLAASSSESHTASAAPTLSGYYQTLSAKCKWWPENYCDLGDVAGYIDNVYISFASPFYDYDPNFANSLGTEFPTSAPACLKLSIYKLRQKNPGAKVFLSVGGAAYWFPSKMPENKIEGILKYVD